MSCMIVSDEHINYILCGLYRCFHQYSIFVLAEEALLDLQTIGQQLVYANVCAFRDRYRETLDAEEESLKFIVDPNIVNINRRVIPPLAELVQLAKLTNCFRYQACDWEDWEDSDADRVTARLLEWIVTNLPGYEEAKWAI